MPGDMVSTRVDFRGSTPVSGSLDVLWHHGVRPRSGVIEPPIQVHRYDEHTIILRQSKTCSYEAPFLYLLFGNDRALLLDTGAVADRARCPVRETVDGLVSSWLTSHPRAAYRLVVAHTHGHGDHVAGDAQFLDRQNTAVVGSDRASVESFFNFTHWPDQSVQFDLGGRVLDLIAIPGHHDASIAIFDPWTGFLLTGDTVYPGRLYVEDMAAFLDSLKRLVALAESRPVRHVLGCHIEMTRTPGRDYPLGTRFQPDEPALQMTLDQLHLVRAAADSVAGSPGAHSFDDFIIYNGPCRRAVVRMIFQSSWARLARWPDDAARSRAADTGRTARV